jgi:hypothetical protein
VFTNRHALARVSRPAFNKHGLSGNPEIASSSGLPASALMGSLPAARKRCFDIAPPFGKPFAALFDVREAPNASLRSSSPSTFRGARMDRIYSEFWPFPGNVFENKQGHLRIDAAHPTFSGGGLHSVSPMILGKPRFVRSGPTVPRHSPSDLKTISETVAGSVAIFTFSGSKWGVSK